MRTCIKCGKEASKIWRIDLDTNGIAMCDKCEDDVTLDIAVANIQVFSGGWEKFGKKYSKIEKQLNKKKNGNRKKS